MTSQRSAPVYLNLFRIHFPVGAVTSIAHRISGVLLFASLPFLIYLLDLSLQGEGGYSRTIDMLRHDLVKLASAPVAWSLSHHLLSGIRFLLMDIEQGVQLSVARTTAWLVNLVSLAATLLYLWWLL